MELHPDPRLRNAAPQGMKKRTLVQNTDPQLIVTYESDKFNTFV
jgi:hypothetical protein